MSEEFKKEFEDDEIEDADLEEEWDWEDDDM